MNNLALQITDELIGNAAVAGVGTLLAAEWSGLHSGDFFKTPSLAFGHGDIDSVLRQLTVTFFLRTAPIRCRTNA